MTLAAALDYFRRREAELRSSEVIIERSVGEGVFDEDTGEVDEDEPDVIYEGPALIRSNATGGAQVGIDVQAGEREVRLLRTKIKFPPDTPVRKDDMVVVTTSEHDAGLVGSSFRITDVLPDDWQITRVALAEQVTGGAEEESS